MSTGTPVNEYQAHAWLSVAAANNAAAVTAAQAAITAINTAVKALNNGSEFSFAEDPPGQITFDEPDGNNGTFTAEGALIVGSATGANAQQVAQASLAAARGAAPAGSTITVEQERGVFVFDLVQ